MVIRARLLLQEYFCSFHYYRFFFVVIILYYIIVVFHWSVYARDHKIMINNDREDVARTLYKKKRRKKNVLRISTVGKEEGKNVCNNNIMKIDWSGGCEDQFQ